MSIHLERQVAKLKRRLLELGGVVEDSVRKAVHAVETRDPDLAVRVIESDDDIDRMEVDIEEECLQILALYQPVASDLRYLVAVLKLNNDLERIGDLAASLAARAKQISSLPEVELEFDFHGMASAVERMLKESLDSLVRMDAAQARKVCADDNVVDDIHRSVYVTVRTAIEQDPKRTASLLPWITVSRILERIADHATNIAEDVIYLVEGEIARHQRLD